MPVVREWAVLGVVLLASSVEAAGDGIDFTSQSISFRGRRVDTFAEDFDGDGRIDLLNVSVNFDTEPPERWLTLHIQGTDGFAGVSAVEWQAVRSAAALFLADVLPENGVEIGFLAEDGAYVVPRGKDGAFGKPVKIVHAALFLGDPSPAQLPLWSGRVDLDADGRNDLLLPLAGGGYRFLFQTAPGKFGRAAALEDDLPPGSPRALEAVGVADRPEYAPGLFTFFTGMPCLQPVDINGDGLLDVAAIGNGTATYFFQKEPGVFSSARPYRTAFAVRTLEGEAKKDTVNLTLLRFVDINADRIADLTVTRIEGTLGLWDSIKTSIYLHLGTGRGNFSPDKCIRIDGVSIDPEFIDLNLDGRLDVVTSRLRTDLMKQAVDMFVLGDVAMSYEVFEFNPRKGMFFPDPVYEKRIFIRKDDVEDAGAGAMPLVFVRGDHSGDGRPDMVVIDPKAQELLIHPGRSQETADGPRISFDATAHWRMPVTRQPKAVDIRDLNGDRLADILFLRAGGVDVLLSHRQ